MYKVIYNKMFLTNDFGLVIYQVVSAQRPTILTESSWWKQPLGPSWICQWHCNWQPQTHSTYIFYILSCISKWTQIIIKEVIWRVFVYVNRKKKRKKLLNVKIKIKFRNHICFQLLVCKEQQHGGVNVLYF